MTDGLNEANRINEEHIEEHSLDALIAILKIRRLVKETHLAVCMLYYTISVIRAWIQCAECLEKEGEDE